MDLDIRSVFGLNLVCSTALIMASGPDLMMSRFGQPPASLPPHRQQPRQLRQRISILEEMQPIAGLDANQGSQQQRSLLLPKPLGQVQQTCERKKPHGLQKQNQQEQPGQQPQQP